MNARFTPNTSISEQLLTFAGFNAGGGSTNFNSLREAIARTTRLPEAQALSPLLALARQSQAAATRTDELARQLVRGLRDGPAQGGRAGRVQSLMQEYALSSEEGVALMAEMQFHMVMNDMRRGGEKFMHENGDGQLRTALSNYMAVNPIWDRDQYLNALTRRFSIARDWAVFFDRYPILLMPNSWERQFPIDEDQISPNRTAEILLAQAPLLSTAVLGLPGLSVPTGLVDGLPVGVQLVSSKFREDLILTAGELIERAANFSVLEALKQ